MNQNIRRYCQGQRINGRSISNRIIKGKGTNMIIKSETNEPWIEWKNELIKEKTRVLSWTLYFKSISVSHIPLS